MYSNYANYNPANNRITTATSAVAGYVYDASGNTLNDGNNEYWYDAEGQLCAVAPVNANGYPIAPYTSYIYDAEGARIGKGTLSTPLAQYTIISANLASSPLCAPPPVAALNTPGTASNGVTINARYLVDQSGDQVTELNTQNGTASIPLGWVHSNVFSAARLTATYDTLGLHYELADPLGTKRVQANISGIVEMSWVSLPFGDALTPIAPPNPPSTANDATEHHFTQKERDAESNNDYFLARYYNSAIGRFTTPDWSAKIVPIPYANVGDPQSLNLYTYVGNNPITHIDSDGHLGQCGGNQGQQAQCTSDLQRLAPGTKVDPNTGKVSKASLLHRIINHLDGNGAGTALVSRIVNDPHMTTITATSDPGIFGPNADKGNITYDPSGEDIIARGANGGLVNAHISGTVVLGHELSHQDQENRGYSNDFSLGYHYFSDPTKGKTYREFDHVREFRTVGFPGFAVRGDITENQLERQLHEPVRATYNDPGAWQNVPPQN